MLCKSEQLFYFLLTFVHSKNPFCRVSLQLLAVPGGRPPLRLRRTCCRHCAGESLAPLRQILCFFTNLSSTAVLPTRQPKVSTTERSDALILKCQPQENNFKVAGGWWVWGGWLNFSWKILPIYFQSHESKDKQMAFWSG